MVLHSHLILPVAENFGRRKRVMKFGYAVNERNVEQFYRTEIRKLNFIKTEFEKERERFGKYFDPNLIFKIKIDEKHSVSEDGMRDALKYAGITTISSAPDKKGYWIAFTDDAEFTKFKTKLSKRLGQQNATFIDAIDGIDDIPKEEKIGDVLKNEPIQEKEGFVHIDVEIWRMSENRLGSFLSGLDTLINENSGTITDQLVTENFCLLRIKIDKKLFEQIIEMREIAHVDRPPRIRIDSILNSDLKELEIKGSPAKDAHGILVIDSGILHHPLLDSAIKDEIALALRSGKITSTKKIDDVGHGTQVAGVSLYGDVQECVERKQFIPEIWIYSAKVMYKNEFGLSQFDPDELLEHQMKDAVEQIVTKYPLCRIINLSIGNTANKMFEGQRQFNLASLIDELSIKFPKIIFVISAGNNSDDVGSSEEYPNYFLEKAKRMKIVDPATAAHALTVGSIFRYTHKQNGRHLDFPSPFTRVGPGLRDMIKPELVEYGGGYGNDIVTLNPLWLKEGRLFTLSSGTSFSAPKVSHHLAKLMNVFPNAPRNLIKAMLISSASIPKQRPEPLGVIDPCHSTKDMKSLLNIYGYGKPNFEKAIYSDDNRVLLLHDGMIKLDHVQFFTINLPEQFIKEKGERKISVTLVYDPPINRNRTDYLGIAMEFHLFKNAAIDKIRNAYRQIKVGEKLEEVIPKDLQKHEIKLTPGSNLRKKGVHQTASKIFTKQPKIDIRNPLVLAVVCQNRWVNEEGFEQPYSVIVNFEHVLQIDLYNQILLRNKTRARVR